MRLREAMGEDWFEKLRPFLISPEFKEIQKVLAEELSMINSTLVPDIEYVFEAFRTCPYKDLKVVILSDRPMHKLKVNDGLAFSVGDALATTASVPLEARGFYEGVEHDIYNSFNLKIDYDLHRITNQGVLLLNASLTTAFRNDEWIDHSQIWRPFTEYVLTLLSTFNTGLVFITCGKKAREFHKFILPTQNYLLPCTHPRDIKHFAQTWDSGGIFSLTNDILKQNNNTQIIW